ncbi:pentatricopeptide repeat-containing protein At3g04760, chloroplastic-like [Pistacia vera]|uniref:pentatricopeptide repeat-containing protein At3g04760, chloroplastic-like n=1 Tax=Pistacia vera TaxID=55513 RepID=UPI001263A175|nr:pentatricopeptide repeat-containing protein At3g04760, chloroplastic-like [Pistacia vera]
MDLSNPAKNMLRYFSISNPNFCLNYLKSLVFPTFSPIPILNYNHFHLKPTSNPSYLFVSSTGSSSIYSIRHPFSQSSQSSHFKNCNGRRSQRLELRLFTSRSYCRHISSSLTVLNCDKVRALRFFKWIEHVQPELYDNFDICSLVVDNCGRLDDYEEMRALLEEFNVKKVCLTEKAFGFLPVMISSKASTRKHIRRVVKVLNEVRGSCRVSGVRALIEGFSVLGSFEMARYVITNTEKKVSYYNILIGQMCRKCDFKGVRDLLDEMRQIGCEPNSQSYNYIFSSLFKKGEDDGACNVFKDMLEKNCPPDAVTYEIFIHNFCRLGKFSVASQFFDDMVGRGIQPRPAAHAAFIKGYFNLQRYKEAHEYVVGSADKYKNSSNMMYSLLASLHDKNRNAVMAKNILLEMIKKGLKPNISVYRRVLKHLQIADREDMASSLASGLSSLSLHSTKESV